MSCEVWVTEDHLRLLKSMYVYSSETGAPAVDQKRPYGNKDIERDVATILGWIEQGYQGEIPEEMQQRAMRLHRATATALQICLAVGKFEPGIYEQRKSYDSRSWERIQ